MTARPAPLSVSTASSPPARELIDGATAIVRGALDAGCDFFAGYPITPASPILMAMMREMPARGGVAIQAEDEIASIGMCIGAAMGGAHALTATSGPGMSLYSENLGLAIMGEVPLVVVDVQRLGPATGGATTVGQGDVQFVRWGTSGGFPVIALAPSSVAESYALTRRAFELAERFRCPVILLTDKGHFQFHVVFKTLHRGERALRRRKDEAGQHLADLRQVAHEHRAQIDQIATFRPLHGRGNAEEHAVGIRIAHCAGFRRIAGRFEADIFANDVHVVVDLAELPHPVVAKAPAHTAEERPLRNAARDRDQHDIFRAVIAGHQLHMQAVSLLMQLQQTRNRFRVLEHRGVGRRCRFCFGRLVLR